MDDLNSLRSMCATDDHSRQNRKLNQHSTAWGSALVADLDTQVRRLNIRVLLGNKGRA